MEKSFGLQFYLKKGRLNDTDKPIYMKITVDGQIREISTKYKCSQQAWDKRAHRVNGKNEIAKSINQHLDILVAKIYAARKKLEEKDIEVTAEKLKLLLQGQDLQKKKSMLLEVFKKHNEQIAALVGQEYAAGTLERYETALKHTRSFLESKYKLPDIDVTKLNFEFISEYEFWLKSVRKCGHNTTMKYLSNFKKIVRRCINYGWIQRDPFTGYKMSKKEVNRVALTETEIKVISEKEFSTSRLALVRDIFLFSCYTGLAYIDVKKLKRSDIVTGVDGEKWVITNRQKTDTTSRIPLLQPAITILKKYETDRNCLQNDLVLPVLSNQKMNAYLKEIVDICGIHKELSYHIARHTFATTVTLSNGVPIETVSKMLGHTNLKTTQQYAKILDLKISTDMQNLKIKLQQTCSKSQNN